MWHSSSECRRLLPYPHMILQWTSSWCFPPDDLCLLLALRWDEASALPITVKGVARSTFVVRGSTFLVLRTTVEKIENSFAIGGRGLLHVFQLPTAAITRVRVELRLPPSRIPLSGGHSSQMRAGMIVYVGVILPLHGQRDQESDEMILTVCPSFPL